MPNLPKGPTDNLGFALQILGMERADDVTVREEQPASTRALTDRFQFEEEDDHFEEDEDATAVMTHLMEQSQQPAWRAAHLRPFYRHRELVTKAWKRCDLLYDGMLADIVAPALLQDPSEDESPVVTYAATLMELEDVHRAGITALRHRHNVTLGLKWAPYHFSRAPDDLRIFLVQLPALMRELNHKIRYLNVAFEADKKAAGEALMAGKPHVETCFSCRGLRAEYNLCGNCHDMLCTIGR